MSLYLSVIGIDGSGKSTLVALLPDVLAAELGVTAAAVGDDFRCKSPAEDLLLPGFAPEGQPAIMRADKLLRRAARLVTAHRRLYPAFKLSHLAAQERVVRRMDVCYHPDLIVSDGNLVLSAAGRALNYAKNCQTASAAAVEALYQHLLQGAPLDPALARSVPGLRLMRLLRRLDERWGLGLTRLPDAVIFLDISPQAALARLRSRGPHARLDRHENLHDLEQARRMYRQVVERFRRQHGEDRVAVIDVGDLSLGQTLEKAAAFIGRLPLCKQEVGQARDRLGTSADSLQKTSTLVKKMVSGRYLLGYALPNLHRGSAHELTFPLSSLGRFLLKEGYSAGVMKAIYERDHRSYGLSDRVFLNYPLHRAVYDRLQLLKPAVTAELRRRLHALATGARLRILTAPSGYAFDLFEPLAQIAAETPDLLKQVQVLALDLDPDGRIEADLRGAAQRLGIQFEFVRGDLTSPEMQRRFEESGPYDLVLFVGLSSWIAKPHLLAHLRLVHGRLLAPGGALIADCFTPHAYALSGRQAGYRAHYYGPHEFTGLLGYCGFKPAQVKWASGRDRINHVCIAACAISQ